MAKSETEKKKDPVEEKPGPPRCRFITSYGGVTRCREAVYFQEFCEFHFEAYLRGEIDGRGHISDDLSDQRRRREINYYGIDLPPAVPPGIDLGAGGPGAGEPEGK